MADSTVQPSGGDFTELATALADAGTGSGDTITISGDWTTAGANTSSCTVADDNITIIATQGNTSRITTTNHAAASASRYRLHVSDGNHCITVNNTGCIIEGIEIKQAGSGSSDEAIRLAINTGTTTIRNCILWSAKAANDQDGIHMANINGTVNLIQCYIYNWLRGGCEPQAISGVRTQTWNINSCGIINCGQDGEQLGGAVPVHAANSNATYNINIHNTYVLDCHFNQNSDIKNVAGNNATINWGISYSIDSDNSIADMDGTGVGNQANRTLVTVDSGVGSYVAITANASPADFTLLDLGNAKNNAQDEHSTATAEGITIPGTDINNTTRPQNTDYDVGAFEVVGGAPPPSTVPNSLMMVGHGI